MHIFHKWGRWVTIGVFPYEWQRRTCDKCGITKERLLK